MATLLTKSYQEVSRKSMTYGELVTYAKYSAQDRETNTTTYHLKTVVHMDYYYDWTFDSANAYLDDAHKVYGRTTLYRGDTTIQEITRTKEHNADGTCPVFDFYSGFFTSYGGGADSRPEIYFPTIQRYAIATSGTNFNDEENPTLTFTNVGLYPLKAKIKVGTTEIYAESLFDQTATSYTYLLTTSQRNQLRQLCTGQSMTVTLSICSMNSNTVLYESTADVTMTIINATPTCTHSEVELNQNVIDVLGTNNANTVVQSVSNIRITVTPTTYKSANVKRVRIIQDNTYYTKVEAPFVFDRVIRNGIFDIEVTDTRDFTSTTRFQKTLISYVKTKINSISFVRQNSTSSNVVVNLTADYTQTTFGSTANVPTIKWKLDSGSYTTIPSTNYTIDTANNTISIINYTLSNVLPYTDKGYFSIELSDLLTTATENDILVIKGIPTMEIGEHDLKVNGKIYLADENGQNPVEIEMLEPLNNYSTSQADVYSCNYANDMFNWTLLGSKTGTTSINLPSSFNELMCIVKIDNNSNVQIPLTIPYACLTTSSQGFNGGYYMAGSSMCIGARVTATKTSASLNMAYLNTSAKTSTTVTDYYYR